MDQTNYDSLMGALNKTPKEPKLNKDFVKTLYENESSTVDEIYDIIKILPLAELMESTLVAGVAEFKSHLNLVLELLKKDFSFIKEGDKLSTKEILQKIREVVTKNSAGMFGGMYTEDHRPRAKDPYYQDFEHARKMINNQLDPGCYICGVTNKELEEYEKVNSTPLMVPILNERVQLQLHHYFIEYSYVNTIDLTLFNTKLLPELNCSNYLKNYLSQNPQAFEKIKENPIAKELAKTNYTIEPLKNQDELDKFIASSPLNMMPLCTVHHRSFHSGIHQILYPFWLCQKVIKVEDVIKQRFYDYTLKHLQASKQDKDLS